MRNLEDLIRDVGGDGLAQVMVIGLVNLLRATIGWSMMTMSFANFVPKWCCLPDNVTASSDQYCNENDNITDVVFAKKCWLNTTSCSNRVFTSGVRTVVNEWDLVCERKWMAPLTTSIQMGGVMVGAVLAGQLTDLFGRKKTVYLNGVCSAVFNIIAGFSPVWEMFVVFRFLIGMSIGGFLASCVPYTTEFILPSRRAIVSILPTFLTGVCLMALVAWLIPDWQMLHWICGSMTIPCLFGYFFIPESLRWLAVQGRVEEAHKVVEWIARRNRREVPKDTIDILKSVSVKTSSTTKRTQPTYIDIYKGWHLFKSSIILQFSWCALSMCGYGFSFGASAIGTNMYLNIFIFAIVGVPSFVITSTALQRFGRKKTSIFFLVLSSACAFGSVAMRLTMSTSDKQVLAGVVLNVLSRGFINCAWCGISITTNEIYPTVIRGLGFGASNVAARVGAVFAPFAINFEDNPIFALGLVGVTLLITATAVIFLDETSGKAMQDTITVPDQSTNGKNIELKVKQDNGHVIIADGTKGNDISTISGHVISDEKIACKLVSYVNFVAIDRKDSVSKHMK
uniref:Major facilitator superfamily (MFS) profile domain-containing protein n=1 Tax=Arion vulgaris TaxID=1028688 RepID=A0A0B7AMJ9_9EUPU